MEVKSGDREVESEVEIGESWNRGKESGARIGSGDGMRWPEAVVGSGDREWGSGVGVLNGDGNRKWG